MATEVTPDGSYLRTPVGRRTENAAEGGERLLQGSRSAAMLEFEQLQWGAIARLSVWQSLFVGGRKLRSSPVRQMKMIGGTWEGPAAAA